MTPRHRVGATRAASYFLADGCGDGAELSIFRIVLFCTVGDIFALYFADINTWGGEDGPQFQGAAEPK